MTTTIKSFQGKYQLLLFALCLISPFPTLAQSSNRGTSVQVYANQLRTELCDVDLGHKYAFTVGPQRWTNHGSTQPGGRAEPVDYKGRQDSFNSNEERRAAQRLMAPPYAPQHRLAALIAYTPSKANDPFLIEPGLTWTAPESGKLYARMNDGEGLDDEISRNEGYIEVGVTDVTPPAPEPPVNWFKNNPLVQLICYLFGGIVAVVGLMNAIPKKTQKQNDQP